MEPSKSAEDGHTLTAERDFASSVGEREGDQSMRQWDIWGSARRHPWVISLSAIMFLVVGSLIGSLRAPQYSASTRLIVQIGTNQSAALGGISEAVIAEAANFSRAVTSNAVIEPAAKSLGISSGAVAARVSATPVPQSGGITVTATGDSSRAAVRLVNAVSFSLSNYVASVGNPGQQPTAILSSYESAAVTTTMLKREVNRLAAQPDVKGAGASALGQAEARLQAALLRQESLKIQYQNALLGPTTRLITVFRPTGASSDRQSRAELLGFVGLLFGIAVGFAAVTSSARRIRPV